MGYLALLRLGGVVAFVAVSTSVAAQEECVRIENDIARLSCFDAAYSESQTNVGDLGEAFSLHRDLVTSDYKDSFDRFNVVATDFDPKSCTYVIGFGRGRFDGARYDALIMKAHEVDKLGRSQSIKGAKFTMKRGSMLREYRLESGPVQSQAQLRDLAEKTNTFLIEYGYDHDDPTIGRAFEGHIYMTTGESRVDEGEIYRSFMDLAETCSKAMGD